MEKLHAAFVRLMKTVQKKYFLGFGCVSLIFPPFLPPFDLANDFTSLSLRRQHLVREAMRSLAFMARLLAEQPNRNVPGIRTKLRLQ